MDISLNSYSSLFRLEKVALIAALLYILLPNLLFWGGWFQPWAAMLICACVIYGLVKNSVLLAKASYVGEPGKLCPAALALLVAFFVLFALFDQFWAGYTGHFEQCPLDFAQRNAVYGNLCDKDWPLVLPDGRYVCYYMAQWLPAAFASRVFPWADRDVILMLWNSLGLFIACILLFCHCRYKIRKTFILLLLLMVLKDPVILLAPMADLFNSFVPVHLSLNGQLFDLETAGRNTINHTVPTFLTSLLVFNRNVPRNMALLAGCLLLPISIFGAIGLVPFIGWRYLQDGRQGASFGSLFLNAAKHFFCSVSGYAALAMAFFAWLYYSHADGSVTVTSMFNVTYGKPLWYIFAKNIVHVGLILLVCFAPCFCKRGKNYPLFWISVGSMAVMNLLYIGKGGPNELAFKGQISAMFVVCLFWICVLEDKRKSVSRWCVIALALVFSFSKVVEIWPRFADFGWKPEHVSNPFNGHLFHPGSLLDQSVSPRKELLVKGLTYEKAGESRKAWPFSLLPPDNAALYQRPACYTHKTEDFRKTPDHKALKIISFF